MKWYTNYLPMFVEKECDFVNITERVEQAVFQSGVREGLCLVNSMHVSAAVFVHYGAETMQAEVQGLVEWMSWMGPQEPASQSFFFEPPKREAEEDPDLKRRVLGRAVVLAITEGRLDLGPAEQVYYGEFDGGREKRVLIKVIGE